MMEIMLPCFVHPFAKKGTRKAICVLLFRLPDPIHHIMAVEENAYGLPVHAGKEPKYHIACLFKVQIRASLHQSRIF
jgi:hypothetical protein